MHSKERLTRLFNGEDIDHIPIWLLFPFHKSSSYANIWDSDSYKPILQTIYEKTDIIDRKSFDTGFCFNAHPDIINERMNYIENDSSISKHMIKYKDVKLTSYVIKRDDKTVIEPMVKDITDLEKILALPYKEPTPWLDWYFDEKEKLGNRGLMGVDLGDPISVLHGLCDETDFVLLCYSETDEVIEFLNIMSDRIKKCINIFWSPKLEKYSGFPEQNLRARRCCHQNILII